MEGAVLRSFHERMLSSKMAVAESQIMSASFINMEGFETRTSDLCSWWLHLPEQRSSCRGDVGIHLAWRCSGPLAALLSPTSLQPSSENRIYRPQLLQ